MSSSVACGSIGFGVDTKSFQLSLDLSQARYNLGLSSIIELSQAQLNLTSAQIASASARFDYAAQNAAVQYQIGALR